MRPSSGYKHGWTRIDLAHLAPMSRLSYVDSLLRVLRAVAPDRDWQIQGRLLQTLRIAACHHHGDRKVGRIPSSAVLLEAALNLATTKADGATKELQRLIHRRDGAMMAMLTLMSMRKRAFVELELGAPSTSALPASSFGCRKT